MLKGGILGCGSICQKRHAVEIAANKNCELYGVYDPVTERAETVAKKYGCKVYKSAEELCADPELDFVVVATPN
jgi:predicted dehydrogenase